MKPALFTLLLCTPCFLVACSTGERDASKANSSDEDEDSSEESKQTKDNSTPQDSSAPSSGTTSASLSESGSSTATADLSTPSDSNPTKSGQPSTDSDNEDSKTSTESGSKSGEKSTTESATGSASKGSTSNSSDSSESSTGSDTADKKAEPSDLSLEVKIDQSVSAGGKVPSTGLRFAVDIQSSDLMDSDGIKSNLMDVAVTIKDGRFKVTVLHPDLEKDLEKEKNASVLLPAVLYIDSDRSQSFGVKDKVVGSFAQYLIYRGPKAPKAEWAMLDAESKQVTPIESAVKLKRLDNVKAVTNMELSGALANLDQEKVKAVALISEKEFLNLKDEFNESERNLDTPIFDVDGRWGAKVENELHDSRRGQVFRGFGEHGFAWLIGYNNGEDSENLSLEPKSTIARNVCYKDKAIVAMWFSPDRWVTTSAGASLAAIYDLNPGWNLGGAIPGPGGSISIGRFGKSFWQKLSAEGRCDLKPVKPSARREMIHLLTE